MKRNFTHYWTNRTWCGNESKEGELLDHTAGNLFQQRGVSSGDAIYVVTVRKGCLYLLGRATVACICSFAKAKRILRTDNLWDASEHIIASNATPMRFDFRVPTKTTQQLLFIASGKCSPLCFVKPGYLDQQTLRGVRELDPASARLLDSLLPADTPILNATKH